jgi:hypothetical protein
MRDGNLAVRDYALTTARATAICPFHDNVTIRVGDDAAETHAYVRATKVFKSDGTTALSRPLLEIENTEKRWFRESSYFAALCGRRGVTTSLAHFRLWHKTDMARCPLGVRLQG